MTSGAVSVGERWLINQLLIRCSAKCLQTHSRWSDVIFCQIFGQSRKTPGAFHIVIVRRVWETKKWNASRENKRAIASAQPPAKSKGWQTMKDTLQWMSSDKTSRVSFILSKPTCQTTIFKSGSRTGGSQSKPSKTNSRKTLLLQHFSNDRRMSNFPFQN